MPVYGNNHPIILDEVTVTGIRPMPELSEEGLEFVNALHDNRNMLILKYNLTDQEYADQANLAINLASKESNFGQGWRGLSYNFRKNSPDSWIQWGKEVFRGKPSSVSRGLTQIKYADDIKKYPDLKRQYDDLGVTEQGIKHNPAIAALATIARINHNEKALKTQRHWSDGTPIPWDVQHAIFWNREKLTDRLNPNPAGKVDADSASGFAQRFIEQKVK